MTRSMLVLCLAAACGGAGSGARPAEQTAPRRRAPEEDPARIPDGYVRMEVRDVVAVTQGEAVLLADPAGAVVLPIFIGGTEAVSIALRLRNEPAPRPLTHDLLDSVIRQLGGELVKVHIDRLVGGIFIGSIFVRTSVAVRRIDARPSDAIALALGNQVPIYVARSVLDQSGVEPSDLGGTQARRPGAAPQREREPARRLAAAKNARVAGVAPGPGSNRMESASTASPRRLTTRMRSSLRPAGSVSTIGGRPPLSQRSPHCMSATSAGSSSRPFSVNL
jgi:uncharacterized protein